MHPVEPIRRESWLERLFRPIWEFFRDLFNPLPAVPSPQITDFDPIRGHPGVELVIDGAHFSEERAQNTVTVGGAKALVVDASANCLRVITHKTSLTGPVEVEVGGLTGLGPVDFEALGPPAPDEDGPPIFFEGAGQGIDQGAPSKGTLRVIVALCQANDLAPPNPAAVRNAVVDTFGDVTTFYDQASYGELDVQVDVTNNWRTLDGTIAEMMDGNNLAGSKLGQIIAEAAQQVVDEGIDLNDYVLIAAMVYTNQGIRAWGGGSADNFTYTNAGAGINIDISTDHNLSLIWINETANWGRCAHEVGHCIVDTPGNLSAWENAKVLGEDVYRSDLVDPNAATAASFDMMGSHDTHPLFSAYYMEQLEYYSAVNIRNLQWDRNPFSQSFDVVAHGDAQNAAGGRYHLVKIKVSDGLYYNIEARQRPQVGAATPAIYDENIPLDGAANQGGVVVTKVLTDVVNMNQQMRFITLLHEPQVLSQGDIATDPARFLTITVENDNVQARPLVCRVRVEWAQVVGDTPGGDFDLRVRPWNGNYETPDIWIDRPPYGAFDSTDPATGEPSGNGDKPQVLAQNLFFGRVHCDGAVDAANVRLTFYVVTPPGVGDNGNWGPLQTKVIPNITKNDSGEANVIWVPEVGEHTCLKIYAEPQAGEVSAGGNNWAQENVFNFEAAAASVPSPLIIPVAVRNPLKERTLALISVRNVPAGFVVHFPHSWVWLEALQERKFPLMVIPTKDVGVYHKMEIPRADIVVDGWIPRQYREMVDKVYPASCFEPMGGILSQVTPKRRVKLELWDDREVQKPRVYGLRGKMDPGLSGEQVLVRLEDPAGRRWTQQVSTGGTGQFSVIFDLNQMPPDGSKEPVRDPLVGVYVGQAFVVNSPKAAQAESNRVLIARKV